MENDFLSGALGRIGDPGDPGDPSGFAVL